MKYAAINKKQREWREKTKSAETTKLCNRQKTKGVVKGEGKRRHNNQLSTKLNANDAK